MPKQRKEMPKPKKKAQVRLPISKFIAQKGKNERTKGSNTYVFQGFYERLKNIDVKHSHSI
jgi:hypothetical protein